MCELKSKSKFQGKVLSGQIETHTRYHENVLVPLRRQQLFLKERVGNLWGWGVPEQEKTKTMMKTKCARDEGAPVARANGDRMIVERWTGF